MSDEKQCFFVESPDGRKFKMVIRGDLGRLSVSKIRRYLANYGVKDDCFLSFNGQPLSNDMVGDDFGLQNNSSLQISYEAEDVSSNTNRALPNAQPSQHEAPRPSNAAPLRPHDAWVNEGEGSLLRSRGGASSTAEDDVRAQLARLEAEKAELERVVQTLSSQQTPTAKGVAAAAGPSREPFENAKANLRVLADDLKLPLQFDSNGTCVLNGEGRGAIALGDGLSLFISYDAQTQRVVLYTTLLTQLPVNDPALLSKLYEVLLEGALLGREVAGGGIGISRESELVVLQTSFSAIHCDATLLRDTVPVFVESVRRWRNLINELMS